MGLMKNSNTKGIIMVLSILLFAASVGILISMSNIDKQTTDTTIYYTATVIRTEITELGKDESASIYVEEYSSFLYISPSVCRYIDPDSVRALKSGQKIGFSIESLKAEQFGKVAFVDIVSLKTEEQDIFSLDEYNAYIHEAAFPARVAAAVMAAAFLAVALLCFRGMKSSN